MKPATKVGLYRVRWYANGWQVAWHTSRAEAIRTKQAADADQSQEPNYISGVISRELVPVDPKHLATWLTSRAVD